MVCSTSIRYIAVAHHGEGMTSTFGADATYNQLISEINADLTPLNFQLRTLKHPVSTAFTHLTPATRCFRQLIPPVRAAERRDEVHRLHQHGEPPGAELIRNAVAVRLHARACQASTCTYPITRAMWPT